MGGIVTAITQGLPWAPNSTEIDTFSGEAEFEISAHLVDGRLTMQTPDEKIGVTLIGSIDWGSAGNQHAYKVLEYLRKITIELRTAASAPEDYDSVEYEYFPNEWSYFKYTGQIITRIEVLDADSVDGD